MPDLNDLMRAICKAGVLTPLAAASLTAGSTYTMFSVGSGITSAQGEVHAARLAIQKGDAGEAAINDLISAESTLSALTPNLLTAACISSVFFIGFIILLFRQAPQARAELSEASRPLTGPESDDPTPPARAYGA